MTKRPQATPGLYVTFDHSYPGSPWADTGRLIIRTQATPKGRRGKTPTATILPLRLQLLLPLYGGQPRDVDAEANHQDNTPKDTPATPTTTTISQQTRHRQGIDKDSARLGRRSQTVLNFWLDSPGDGRGSARTQCPHACWMCLHEHSAPMVAGWTQLG